MGIYAVEENRTYGAKNRVCVEGAADAQFPDVVPGVWGEREEGIQMEGTLLREGIEGMGEESKSSPEQLPEDEVCEMVRLKMAHLSWGPRKIRELYLRRHGEAASERSFKRVLERAGVIQKRRRRRSGEAGRLSSGRRGLAVNEVWTVDFRGWWSSGGQRYEPLTVRDEHSRYVIEVRALEDARSETVRESIERLFEQQGCPPLPVSCFLLFPCLPTLC
jgi:putative transposase